MSDQRTCKHKFGSGEVCERGDGDPIHDLSVARLNSHPFVSNVERLRFAYADPPYLGCCDRYNHHHPDGLCWDWPATHWKLINRLYTEFPDGWALSCSSVSLPMIYQACRDDVRIGAWVKPFCSFKPNVNPAYAWEPVIFFSPAKRSRTEATVRDWVSASITLQRGTCGAKPLAFAYWIFELLGMKPEDEFVDLFPGSGAVSGFWESWKIVASLGLEYSFHAEEVPALSFDQQP